MYVKREFFPQVEAHLNRRWTQMNADAEEQQRPGRRAVLSALICVHLRFHKNRCLWPRYELRIY
jgi:hypothetical protein